MLINFSDGVFDVQTQNTLKKLSNNITLDELKLVENRLYSILSNIGRRKNNSYKVNIMPNILLQITLKNKSPILQYGAHRPFNIQIIKMSDKEPLRGKIAEDIILAHETGHALLGDKNYIFDDKYGTRLMEKITDEVAKFKLANISPTFYKMYELCRHTHHYKTKEGDFKEFFKDIIKSMEDDWLSYRENNKYMYQ